MANPIVVFVVGLVAIAVAAIYNGVHQIEEGHIGVYWIGGAMSDRVTKPGYHWKMPFITKHANIQITLQTDVVRSIPCGTQTGVVIYFDSIEVVNRLNPKNAHKTIKLYGTNYDKTWIFDKIHHEINQFCSAHSLQEVYIDYFSSLDEDLAKSLQQSCDKWETGIEIIAIRVTKPRIPQSVRKNYESIEQQRTSYLVAVEKAKVVRREQETEKMKQKINAEREALIATISAQKEANISKIAVIREIAQKEGEKKKSDIENQMLLNSEKAKADAEFYKIMKEAEANKLKFTEPYLKYVLYTSLSNNTKIFFGEKVPSIFSQFLAANQNANPPIN